MIRLLCRQSFRPARAKAASLYIVIVIALIIALLCEALIAAAFYYRTYHALRSRQERLDNNMMSGINLVLTDHQPAYFENKSSQLFEDERDTVRLSKRFWGGFDIGVSKAYMGKDSSVIAVMMGNRPDSAKFYALWLADEDRPLSVTGKSMITGKAFLPKAGIRAAYVDGISYQGPPELLKKKYLESKKDLPEPEADRLSAIDKSFNTAKGSYRFQSDTVNRSFGAVTDEYLFSSPATLSAISLKGNIIIRCDSLLTIDSTAKLDNVMIFAPGIVVRSGFQGRCQLFARDSISIGDRCEFSYPSMAALVRGNAEQVKKQGLIRFGKHCSFSGTLITWEKVSGIVPPAIDLGENGTFNGQIYTGLLGFGGKTIINGSVTCRRFYYLSGFSRFENYLVDIRIDANALSTFFSSAKVLPDALPKTQKIVIWLK